MLSLQDTRRCCPSKTDSTSVNGYVSGSVPPCPSSVQFCPNFGHPVVIDRSGSYLTSLRSFAARKSLSLGCLVLSQLPPCVSVDAIRNLPRRWVSSPEPLSCSEQTITHSLLSELTSLFRFQVVCRLPVHAHQPVSPSLLFSFLLPHNHRQGDKCLQSLSWRRQRELK